MFERFRERLDTKAAKRAENLAKVEAARITALTNSILSAMCQKDGTFKPVRQDASELNAIYDMNKVGAAILESGMRVRIGQTCSGFNTIGTAIGRHTLIVPDGQELPEYWNPIFPPGPSPEGTKPFKLFDNIPGKEGINPIVGANIGSFDPFIGLAVQQSMENS